MTYSKFKWVAIFLLLMFPIVIVAGNTGMPLRPFLFFALCVIFALFCFKIFLMLGNRIIKKFPSANIQPSTKGLIWFVWAILFCGLAFLAFGGLLYIVKILGL